MNRKLLFIVIFTISILFFSQSELLAQCAMCKSVPTSNTAAGGNRAAGLNTGILYLMSIPYIALAGLAWFFFKKQIKARLKALWS